MNKQTVIRRLRALCNGRAQKDVADELGISPQLLCDILKGRREPGPKLLRGLGMERSTTYRMERSI